jgi:hypothetical protein
MEQPETVKHAALLWVVAVIAGVIETVFAVSEIAQESGIDDGTWTNIGVRSAVYVGALVIVGFFAAGRRWARLALVVLLSVIGLASMVVPSAMQLADGEPLIAAVGGDGKFALAFFVTRMAHLAAVLAATVLMFTPSANRAFAGRRPEPVAA